MKKRTPTSRLAFRFPFFDLFEPAYGETRRAQLVALELILWAALCAAAFFIGTARGLAGIAKYVAPTFVALSVVVFRLVFDYLPFDFIRRARRLAGTSSLESLPEASSEQIQPLELAFRELAMSSRRLSERIFGRAGVYLLIGALIAMAGVTYLALTAPKLAPTEPAVAIVATLAPRFGLVFFVELIAFFFLRQYREAMDEFRYYESIKRSREDNLAILRVLLSDWGSLDVFKIMEKVSFRSEVQKLSQGETTELLESRKLTKDELALFERIVEAIGKRVP